MICAGVGLGVHAAVVGGELQVDDGLAPERHGRDVSAGHVGTGDGQHGHEAGGLCARG